MPRNAGKTVAEDDELLCSANHVCEVESSQRSCSSARDKTKKSKLLNYGNIFNPHLDLHVCQHTHCGKSFTEMFSVLCNCDVCTNSNDSEPWPRWYQLKLSCCYSTAQKPDKITFSWRAHMWFMCHQTWIAVWRICELTRNMLFTKSQ